MGDSRDHTTEKLLVFGNSRFLRMITLLGFLSNRTESQRVERTDRPRTHRENISNNTADSSSRTLEWFHRARMIMGLDFEGNCQSISNINNSSVLFSGAHQNF